MGKKKLEGKNGLGRLKLGIWRKLFDDRRGRAKEEEGKPMKTRLRADIQNWGGCSQLLPSGSIQGGGSPAGGPGNGRGREKKKKYGGEGTRQRERPA